MYIHGIVFKKRINKYKKLVSWWNWFLVSRGNRSDQAVFLADFLEFFSLFGWFLENVLEFWVSGSEEVTWFDRMLPIMVTCYLCALIFNFQISILGHFVPKYSKIRVWTTLCTTLCTTLPNYVPHVPRIVVNFRRWWRFTR